MAPNPTTPDIPATERLPETKAEEVSALLRVVANSNRLRILCLLHEGERSVGEIERELGIRQPTLSQQLGELRDAALVATRREHKVVFYALTDQRAVALLAALHDIFCAEKVKPARTKARPQSGRRSDEAARFAVVGGGQ